MTIDMSTLSPCPLSYSDARPEFRRILFAWELGSVGLHGGQYVT